MSGANYKPSDGNRAKRRLPRERESLVHANQNTWYDGCRRSVRHISLLTIAAALLLGLLHARLYCAYRSTHNKYILNAEIHNLVLVLWTQWWATEIFLKNYFSYTHTQQFSIVWSAITPLHSRNSIRWKLNLALRMHLLRSGCLFLLVYGIFVSSVEHGQGTCGDVIY